jgi:hypothetical protein
MNYHHVTVAMLLSLSILTMAALISFMPEACL